MNQNLELYWFSIGELMPINPKPHTTGRCHTHSQPMDPNLEKHWVLIGFSLLLKPKPCNCYTIQAS